VTGVVRRLVLVSFVLVAVLGVMGCGGSSETADGAGEGSEEVWSGEVAAVVHHVGEDLEALGGEFKSLPPQQSAAEGMYLGLSEKVDGIEAELEAIKTPEQCKPTMSKIVDSTGEFGAFAKELGEQPTMTTKEYAALAHEKITDISKTVEELAELSAAPHC
jgi:hypothetical protein